MCFCLASSVASSSGSLVDASGYKFSEKDMKPGKIKLKKSSSSSSAKTAKGKKPEKGMVLISYCLPFFGSREWWMDDVSWCADTVVDSRW